jgi:hypothetical protein
MRGSLHCALRASVEMTAVFAGVEMMAVCGGRDDGGFAAVEMTAVCGGRDDGGLRRLR